MGFGWTTQTAAGVGAGDADAITSLLAADIVSEGTRVCQADV